jgi:hypothetical protein
VLADPVESDDDPVLDDADGVAVVVVVPVDDAVDEVVALLDMFDVPEFVWAATTASTATAAVPSTPKDVASLLRRRSARFRSATVMRRFGAGITRPPGAALSLPADRCAPAACRGAAAALHEDR